MHTQVFNFFQSRNFRWRASNLLKGGENFGLAEEIRIALEIQGAGRLVQLIQSTLRQTVPALTNSWLSC